MGRSYLVVGGGTQGLVAARALRSGPGRPSVAVVDSRPAPAGARFRWLQVDATSPKVGRLAADADACVVALPGDLADAAVARLARAGARVADMSFVPEPVLPGLHRAARRSGAVVLRDMGVAPGLSHVLAAALHGELGGLDRLTVYVGGLPRTAPPGAFRHAVYFNPVDLISEYTRPARLRRHGRDGRLDPLAPRHQKRLRDARVGGLEAFPSDGLRTLLTSFPECRDMIELTLRWPGHLREMRRLRAAGLLASGRGGAAPALLTATALDEAFPGLEHPDLLLMVVHGRRAGRRAGYRLFDTGRAGLTAMSRTTAFTAAAAARALANGRLLEPGLHPPERLGADPSARWALLADLRRQGLRLGRRTLLRPAA